MPATVWRPTVAEKRRRTRSARTRITLVAVAAVAVLLGIGAVGTVWMIDRVLTGQIASQLDDDLDAIADAVDERGIAAIAEQDDDVLVALHTAQGVSVNDEDALELPHPRDTRGASGTRVDGEPVLIAAEETDEGVLVVARSTEDVGDAVAAAATALAVAVPIGVALIGIVVWFVAARALGPVERIRRRVDQIGSDSLDQRVPRTGRGDEIDRLAGTMNRMLDRVEDGYRARQRFVSDASHELRSPLATMRQYAELACARPDSTPTGELAEVVLSEGLRMQDIVDGLLLLARLDEGAARGAVSADVDLDDLVLAEASRIRALGTVGVDGTGITPVRVRGAERLLARAVRNLVDNAVRHARDTVVLSVRVEDGRAILVVDDDGPGIAEADRERVFERFTRLDEARSRDAGGSGLGLAIVREIARSHGGEVRVDTAPGGGARFTLLLPAVEDQAGGPGSGAPHSGGADPRV